MKNYYDIDYWKMETTAYFNKNEIDDMEDLIKSL